jgi:O-antigen/teichoic acid export membrane protein
MITRHKIISSLAYKFAERFAGQGITFVIGIMLARLLSPEDYGTIAIMLIFIHLAQVFVQAGLGTALIQKKDTNDIDYSSVFFASLFLSAFLYFVVFLSAPYIALYYKMSNLTVQFRYLALILMLNSYVSIQTAKITKEMQFRKLLYSSVGAAIISGSIGLIMAYRGFGVWTLVWQQLINSIASGVIMTFTVKWHPKWLFSFYRLKILFSFGYKMLFSSLLDTVYHELKGLIIGKKYSTDALGYFNRGEQYPKMGVSSLNGTILSVMLPAFAAEQDNKNRVKAMVRRTITISTFFVFPAMVGLAAIARPIVKIMLTEKWLPCVPYLMISCGIYAFYPIHTANLQAIAAMGKSNVFLNLELIKKSYGIGVLIITVIFFDTPIAIMLGALLSTPISCIVNAFPNKQLLNYSIVEQACDILPTLGISLLMGISVYGLSLIGWNDFITLAIQIITGVISYVFLAHLFKIEALRYTISILKASLQVMKRGKSRTN